MPKYPSTIFFSCCHDWDFNLIPSRISDGEFAIVDWFCSEDRRAEIGDRAYLLRDCGNPKGIIAAGSVIAAPEDKQLRNTDPKYSYLSATYISCNEYARDEYSRAKYEYNVCLKLDSCVDFDAPLEETVLSQLPEFKGCIQNSHQYGYFRSLYDYTSLRANIDKAQALASEWEKYSLAQQLHGKGFRLIDILLGKGDEAMRWDDYELALSCYQQALEIDLNCDKAINQLKICQSAINFENIENNRLIAYSERPDLAKITPPDISCQSELAKFRDELANEESFASTSTKEFQKRVLVEIARRQGQTKFRQALLDAYNYKCAITGFDAGEALEAAHIIPYAETENQDPRNGLLLRADLHTLFDLNFLAIHPDTFEIYLHPDLQQTEYRSIHGTKMRIPKEEAFRPDPDHLRQRLKQCTWLD
jgi:hypothetical protein